MTHLTPHLVPSILSERLRTAEHERQRARVRASLLLSLRSEGTVGDRRSDAR